MTNSAATAQIVGMTYGIKMAGTAGSVINFGTITVLGGSSATYAAAIKLAAGGLVDNATGGIISGGTTNEIGVTASGIATVTNAGTITAAVGVVLGAGGSVNNSSVIQGEDRPTGSTPRGPRPSPTLTRFKVRIMGSPCWPADWFPTRPMG